MEERVSQRSHRRAAVVAIGGCLLVASVVSFCRAPKETTNALGSGRVDLLNVDRSDEGKEAAKLQAVHAAYDKAKQRLQQMSVQYGHMGENLQQAESNAAALREELEERMAKIEHEFGLAHPPPSEGSKTLTLAAIPKSEGKSLRAVGPSTVTSPPDAKQSDDEAPVQSVRAVGTQFVSSLTQLQQVQQQLQDENKKICELCGSSALLRINRAHTCARCSTAETSGGDTDIESFLESAAASRRQSEGSDGGGSEDAGKSTEEARSIPTIQLATSGEKRVTQAPSATTIIDGLFGTPSHPAAAAAQNSMAREMRNEKEEDVEWGRRRFPPLPQEDKQAGEKESEEEKEWNARPITEFPPYAPAAGGGQAEERHAGKEERRVGGQSLLAALGLLGGGGGGAMQQGHRDQSIGALRSRGELRSVARNSELMEVDRGDAGEKIASRGAEGAIGAWYNAGREHRFLLGVCWPTRAEEASVRLCGICARSLGKDVTSLSETGAVSCSPYHPAEGKSR